MAICCADVLSLKIFSHIELMAGRTGLSRIITWPHIGQTERVSEWVHGGELLFITGVIHSSDQLMGVLKECITKRLAGLVVLVGNEYIREIPEPLIIEANRAGFPLFRMPWNIKLIDVTRAIIDLIMRDKFELKQSKSFLGRLLFSSDVDYTGIVEMSAINGMALQPYYFVAVFNLTHHTEERVADFWLDDNCEDDFENTLRRLLKEKNLVPVTMVFGNNVICLVSQPTAESASEAVGYMTSAFPLLTNLHKEIKIYLGLGRIYSSPEQLKKSYQEALKSLDLCKKSGKDSHVTTYEEIGICRLLFEIQNTEEIRAFYRYHLSDLIRHDQENNSELVKTLRQYLYCNCNLVKTSQTLFIHRNTLIYRLNKIRDILDKDIDDAVIKLDLFNSIIAKEYLNE